MVRVLVVAQLPPPYLGQPIMLQHLVQSEMRDVKLQHLPMRLSQEVSDVGRFGWTKLFRLLPIIARIIHARFASRPDIMYYAPATATRMSIFRDFAILIPTRFLFPRSVFHFHASGHSELYAKLSWWQRLLFRLAYFRPDAAIRLSELTPQDGRQLEARHEFIVANGIADPADSAVLPKASQSIAETEPLRILFVSSLCESKGLLVLIDACGKLAQQGVPFHLDVMGRFQGKDFEARVRSRIAELKLQEQIHFLGQITGDEKFAVFAKSDVLCHPTLLDTFPVVLLEAMAMRLPIVSTQVGGIPSIIDHQKTGFLVAPGDSGEVADRLIQLADDSQLREKLGAAGRTKFEREYVLDRHIDRMRDVFLAVAAAPSGASCDAVAAL
jgi:glycosyltransferase involved in cell wall biosynthesis